MSATVIDPRTRAHLGVGWAFPIKPSGGRLGYVAYEDDVDRAIPLILLTSPGERAMLPDFGAGLRRFVFEPNSPVTHRAIEVAVKKALSDWEPRIRVQRVEAVPDDERENLLLIHIDYLISATNSYYNRVFPFHLLEGRG